MITVLNPEIPDFILHNCDNHNVRVEITEDYYDRYRVDFTGTDSELVDPLSFSNPFDFMTQGSYRIDVTGVFDNAADNCGTDNQVINTINSITQPVLVSVETEENASNGIITLNHTLGDDIIYDLQSSVNGSGNLNFSQSVSGASTEINGVNTSDDYFCYQIDTYDACSETTSSSNVVCSTLFNVTTADDGNQITWQTDETITTEYNVLRNGNLLFNQNDPGILAFVDTAVICNREYIYNVQSIFSGGFSVAIDTAVIATQSGSLPKISSLPSSTVLEEAVRLTWSPPDTGDIPFNRYLIEKNINSRGWRDAGSTMDTTFTDTNASFIGGHSYRILYDDECGNLADESPTTQPMILEQISARGRVVTYRWNKYETWLQGIRGYILERLDSAGNLAEEFPVLSGREWSIEFGPNDLTDKLIRVRAESLDDTPLNSYSNVLTTALKTEMYLPTAFTPDGDNLNDRFIVKGPSVFNFKMEIYNRWGNLIFVTNDYLSGWDGLIGGEDAPEGTYIYKIFFEDGEGRKFDQSGAFTLLRKGSQ